MADNTEPQTYEDATDAFRQALETQRQDAALDALGGAKQ